MTDVKVEQCDRSLAAAIESNGVNHTLTDSIIAGNEDESWLVLKIAQFRQAAEKAQQERDAGIAYWKCAETRHVTLGDKVATAIRSQNDG